MSVYRFIDGTGDVAGEGEFPDHSSALAWARAEDARDEDAGAQDIERVEFLGPDGDWRWAGALPT